jgi:hypothetical protein
MYSLQLKAHVGKDGILRLETPIDLQDADVDVVLVVQPVNEALKLDKATWMRLTYGSLADVDLERPSQGEFEVREPIE